jgi:pyruvate/2-oxoglutarate dehydrogenase complex dihydrolipoamide dehydrogenase (E3) component
VSGPRLLAGGEDDRRLRAAVHPDDWRPPEPAPRYHLVVLGAGTAGLVTAAGAAGLGAKVALVERDLMGGDCLNVGCVPSKALLAAARAVGAARRASTLGVECGAPGVEFARVLARLRRLRAEIAVNDSAERFRALGIDVFFGEARFAGGDAVEVGGRTLRFRRAVIATGARPVLPSIPGLVEASPLTNETVFAIERLPRRIAVIGAGPIGCELAQAFARFGADVHLLEAGERILPRDDAEAAAVVQSALDRDGVRTTVAARIERCTSTTARTLHLAGGTAHEVDEILVAAGRAPNVEGLALERAGVAVESGRGIVVDDFLCTTNRAIYACGDVATPLRFTHHSDAQARIVVRNALFFGRARASALRVPWCTYTDPELAQVGLTEADARRRGIPIRTFVERFAELDRAILDGETEGFVKILLDARRDRILGATIVGSHAGDLVSEISVAMSARVGLGKLASVIHPYPTRAEAIRKLGDRYNRSRLTPMVKALFETFLAWRS